MPPLKRNMPPEDIIRIQHMIDAAETALRFVVGRCRNDLDHDQMFAFALVRAVEIVGEAASKISWETREENPEIPWSAIVGMRNWLVHAYFKINYDLLWRTVSDELPPLLDSILNIKL